MKKFLLLLALCAGGAGWYAYENGYIGWMLGKARVEISAKDKKLLSYFPEDTRYLGLVQMHHIKIEGKSWDRLEELAADLEEITGVRVATDVDAVGITEELQVARGRFDWNRMKPHLRGAEYQLTNEGGRPIAVRKDSGDTLCLDDGYLLHGDFERVKAALDRREDGDGLTLDSELGQDIEAIGWNHAAIAVARISDKKLSVKDILKGNKEMKSFGVSVDTTADGYPLVVLVDAGSAASASTLAAEIEGYKKTALEAMKKEDDDPDIRELRMILRNAKIETIESRVRVRFAISTGLVDRAIDESAQMQRKFNEVGRAGLETLLRAF